MTGFEPQASGVQSNHCANWATAIAQNILILPIFLPFRLTELKVQSDQRDQ